MWVPKQQGDKRPPSQIPEAERDYYLERRYPSFGNLVPRDVASRAAKAVCDEGRGVGDSGLSVYLDFADAIKRHGVDTIAARYGNLFDMYRRITDENPYQVPMRIYPAVHYTMGGLWVDYNLMSTIPGLFVLGEANFSDHGANRLGASALMQGLADGYFVAPYTVANYLGGAALPPVTADHDAFGAAAADAQARIDRVLQGQGHAHRARVPSRHRRDLLGPGRHGAHRSRAQRGDRGDPARCARSSGRTSPCPATPNNLNPGLDYAGRVADYMEFAEVLALDALERRESCGGHFREEFQTPDGEALRKDDEYSYVAAWEFNGRRDATRAAQGAAGVRRSSPDAAELQVGLRLEGLRA